MKDVSIFPKLQRYINILSFKLQYVVCIYIGRKFSLKETFLLKIYRNWVGFTVFYVCNTFLHNIG